MVEGVTGWDELDTNIHREFLKMKGANSRVYEEQKKIYVAIVLWLEEKKNV